MFRYKKIKEQLYDERRKNEALAAQIIEVTDALVEIAELSAVQDDALVELAEIMAESEVNP